MILGKNMRYDKIIVNEEEHKGPLILGRFFESNTVKISVSVLAKTKIRY